MHRNTLMRVQVLSITSKPSKFGTAITTVTVKNPNGRNQYFQLAPWNYKAAKLDTVMIEAKRATVNNYYEISFRDATIKGRKVTLLTKFSECTTEEVVWEGDAKAPTSDKVLISSLPEVKQESSNNLPINYDTTELESLEQSSMNIPVEAYPDYNDYIPLYDAMIDYKVMANV